MKSLVDANDVWLGQTTFKSRVQIKRSITLDLLVRSCINFYRCLRTMFSLASTRYLYSMPTTSCQTRPPTRPEYRLKRSIILDSTVGSCSNFYRSFRWLFCLASRWNRYSTTRVVYRLNRSKNLEPTVGSRSKFSGSLQRLFSLASTRYRYSTPTTSGRDTPPTTQEYRVKMSITLIPTVGSCSNFYRSLWRLFS
jgi:hypothetical protein